MPGYAWKPERGTGEMADAPVKAHDDACDALRYAVMAHVAPEPAIITLYKRLAAEAQAERTEQAGRASAALSEPCGERFRTPIPSIARCGLPRGHAGPHEEEASA
jgi:hypothetical protein